MKNGRLASGVLLWLGDLLTGCFSEAENEDTEMTKETVLRGLAVGDVQLHTQILQSQEAKLFRGATGTRGHFLGDDLAASPRSYSQLAFCIIHCLLQASNW